MKRALLAVVRTLLGFVILFAGIYLSYLYLKSLDQHGNLLFLGLGLIFVVAGGYLLLKTGGSTDTVLVKDDSKPGITSESGPSESLIERNNRLGTEWDKTTEKRDKLRIVGAATAEDGKK